LNRREFHKLPAGWEASFASPRVRAVFTNFTLRVVREFKPHYLGLPSEINAYVDAAPRDFENYLSLYLAVAEGGFTNRAVGPFQGSPQDQVDYLSAIHTQLGSRLDFWVYLLLSDFNLDSYAKVMKAQGLGGDINTLGMFAAVGLREFNGQAKAGLSVWDGFRMNK
jgi:hypothetical protein